MVNAGNEMEFLRNLLSAGKSFRTNDGKFDALSIDESGVRGGELDLYNLIFQLAYCN